MGNYLLSGKISDGMFPNERAVEFTDSQGEPITVLADSSLLVSRDGQQYLKVRLIDRKNGNALVLLPGEVYGAAGFVYVSGSLLQPP